MERGRDKHTFIVNTTSYEVIPCTKCRRAASESEALRAEAEWHGDRSPCAICGGAITASRVIVEHRVIGPDPGTLAWKVRSIVFDNVLVLEAPRGVPIRVHTSCARATFRHASWGDLDLSGHVEAGRLPAMWDSPTTYYEIAHTELTV
jgi:hypothetical protein